MLQRLARLTPATTHTLHKAATTLTSTLTSTSSFSPSSSSSSLFSRRAMSAAASSAPRVLLMDPFCLKQFLPSTGGQHIPIPCSPDFFVDKTNEVNHIHTRRRGRKHKERRGREGGRQAQQTHGSHCALDSSSAASFHFSLSQYYASAKAGALKDGYAPFCKHLFIPASYFDLSLPCGYAAITPENEVHLKTSYAARTEKELPVLTRFFAKGSVKPAEATYLDVILYSRAQIEKENAAMKAQSATSPTPAAENSDVKLSDANNTQSAESSSPSSSWEWGIVSIKPQDVDYETPMNPITVMRNALGVSEGGSGIPLDRQAYMQSVDFWSKHALLQ